MENKENLKKQAPAEQYVWEFTNQKKLNKKEFIDYFERKIFRTIRKSKMLPKNRVIKLKKSAETNYLVLKSVLEQKFKVINGNDFVSINLSELAERVFVQILKGNFYFSSILNVNAPLYYLSDTEIKLYAKLKTIKGKERKINKKVRLLFNKFIKKNQDLEINIIKAANQFTNI